MSEGKMQENGVDEEVREPVDSAMDKVIYIGNFSILFCNDALFPLRLKGLNL
uniref:Uncharacterized protein n=1 Tax=Rhizophora mucronata TaxID=61149 RepID=A0A2P2LNE9_RHIMU